MTYTNEQIRRWADKQGYREAVVALVIAGVGTSTAEKLCNGTYKHVLGKRLMSKIAPLINKKKAKSAISNISIF